MKVYRLVKQIPRGRVATYGQIGEALGSQRLARAVGNALHRNPYSDVPCYRVVNREGKVAERFGKGGWQDQKRRLLAERVEFVSEKRVNLNKHLFKNF